MLGGAFLIFLAVRSIFMEGGIQNFWLIVIVLVLIVMLSKTMKKEETIVNPKEAELLVERELERKSRWKQFPLNSTYDVGPVSDLKHTDARGLYYNVAVKVNPPFDVPKHYVGKVMADGKERTFTTLIESIGPMNGRSIPQERDITKIPDYVKRAEKYDVLSKLWGFGR